MQYCKSTILKKKTKNLRLPSRKKKKKLGGYHYNEEKKVTTDPIGIKQLMEYFEYL